MTDEMVNISLAELERLKERAKKLALDKSYQQLVMQLMNRMSEATGLDNVIGNMLQAIVDVIGGANLILYYKIDDDFFYADVYGEKKQLTTIDDERVALAFATGEAVEYEHDFSDTQMMTPAFTNAYTWIYPLKVGNKVIGVFKLESLHIAMRELYKQLPLFFNYAALVLKNEILGHCRLQLINKQLQQEIDVRRKTEQALIDAKNQAETASRAKSVFLANMSHELRTPMNAVLGFSQLLLKDPDITPSQLESLNIINNSGKHLLSLINEILDMAKIEAGKIVIENSNFDLGALIYDAIDMMSERAEIKHLNLSLEQSSEFPRFVNTDESKLRQILINLIGNAIKYTKQGSIMIRLNAEPLDNQKYLLSLTVEDTGIGIAPKDLPLIFESFVQVGHESDRQGSGLGLPITKQYVKLLGGTIQANSELGKGSIFIVKLPVTRVSESEVIYQTENETSVKKLAPNQQSYRILVVEDQLENRILLKKLLESVGFEVSEAINGKEAIEQFIRLQPDFIWMDRRMPVMDGIEATEKIRALPKGKNVKIVALTASVFTQQRQQFLDAGVNDIITKPYREKDIFDSLSKHLGVKFVYEEPSKEEAVASEPLCVEKLEHLPKHLLIELEHTCASLDIEQSLTVVDEIKAIDPCLAEQLAKHIQQFDFETINKLFVTLS
ncbi:two-component system, sensor histidine kinase [Patescibacteria group bacterium]|nr:two-component system, sensor histidine kinase [Patescibacteria group bacterium]